MNTDINIFCEKLMITFHMVKYGFFLYPIVFLLNLDYSKYYLNELILFTFELILMLLFLFSYTIYKRIVLDEIINVDELLD
jgi:hypothetical protein